MVEGERLAERVAIVTGGARGLGHAIAQRFAAEGASVVIVDIRDELGQEAAAVISRCEYVHGDVADEDDWERVIAHCQDAFGPPDVLVSNAYNATMCTIEEETREGWDRTIAVTLTGAFLGMRAVIPGMRQQGHGAIVAVSSTHGGNVAVPQQAAYQAAKAGLTALTRNAAVTYGRDNIRANAIHPGPIRTPMIDELGLGDLQAQISKSLPLGRVATTEEIADAALYLASDEASYVTGSALIIDGGYTAL